MQKSRDELGRVREVAVQGHQHLIGVLMCPADTIPVGAADAEFPTPMKRVDARILRGKPIDDLTCPIGGIVIKKQIVGFKAECLDLAVEFLDVLRFVIGWDKNQTPKPIQD